MEALGAIVVVIGIVFVLASSVVWGHDSRDTMIDDRLS
jgi:uncharacterized protein involved in outer membrane biogenesis